MEQLIHSQSKPLVSIVIPAYNTAPYIQECLSSVAGQTYANLEIVVIDDGSNDGTGKLIDSYSNDPRFVIHHQVNAGSNAATNWGLDHLRGDYFMIMGSDDYLDLTIVEKCMNVMLEDGCDLVRFYFQNFEGHKVREPLHFDHFNSGPFFFQKDFRQMDDEAQTSPDQAGCYHFDVCKIFSAKLLKNKRYVGGTALNADSVFATELAIESSKMMRLSVVGYFRRVHLTSQTHGLSMQANAHFFLDQWHSLFTFYHENHLKPYGLHVNLGYLYYLIDYLVYAKSQGSFNPHFYRYHASFFRKNLSYCFGKGLNLKKMKYFFLSFAPNIWNKSVVHHGK